MCGKLSCARFRKAHFQFASRRPSSQRASLTQRQRQERQKRQNSIYSIASSHQAGVPTVVRTVEGISSYIIGIVHCFLGAERAVL